MPFFHKLKAKRLSLIVSALLPVALARGAAAPEERAAVPASEQQKQAAEAVDQVYPVGPKVDAARQLSLARQLLAEATSGKDAPAVLYVEFCRARDLAVEFDLELAFRAIDATAARFAVDAFQMKFDLLAARGREIRVPSVDPLLSLSMEADQRGRLDLARRAADMAVGLAERSNDLLGLQHSREQKNYLAVREKDARILENARARLKSNPDDIEASTSVGRMLCLENYAWAEGLPYLLKAPDSALRHAVALDMRNPNDAAAIEAAADAWWDAASLPATNKWFPNAAARARAAMWYRKLIPTLSGISRARAQKRVYEAMTDDQGRGLLLDPDCWETYVYSGSRWEPAEQGVAVSLRFPGMRVTNTIDRYPKAFFTCDCPVSGDFTVALSVDGPCLLVLIPTDRTDRSIYCELPDDGKVHEVAMKRKGPALSAQLDGKPFNVRLYKASPTIPGFAGIMIDKGKSVDLRQFRLIVGPQ
jgi:hypothetical protein